MGSWLGALVRSCSLPVWGMQGICNVLDPPVYNTSQSINHIAIQQQIQPHQISLPAKQAALLEFPKECKAMSSDICCWPCGSNASAFAWHRCTLTVPYSMELACKSTYGTVWRKNCLQEQVQYGMMIQNLPARSHGAGAHPDEGTIVGQNTKWGCLLSNIGGTAWQGKGGRGGDGGRYVVM